MQPNPNPNNKVTQSIEALNIFQTYLITLVGLNEIQLWSGKVIKPNHTPIITEEECEPSREGIVDHEVDVTLVTINKKWIVMPLTAKPGRIVSPIITNLSKDGTSVAADSNVMTRDPQILIETRMTSQPKSDFLRELKNLHVQIPLLQALK